MGAIGRPLSLVSCLLALAGGASLGAGVWRPRLIALPRVLVPLVRSSIQPSPLPDCYSPALQGFFEVLPGSASLWLGPFDSRSLWRSRLLVRSGGGLGWIDD